MSTRTDIVAKLRQAQQTRSDEDIKIAGDFLTDDATMVLPRGRTVEGKAALLEAIKNPGAGMGGGGGFGGGGLGGGGGAGGMMGRLQWSEPSESGDTVTTGATLPPGLPVPIKGIELAYSFTGEDKVNKVELKINM